MNADARAIRQFERLEISRLGSLIEKAVAAGRHAKLPALHAELQAIAMHSDSPVIRKLAANILDEELAEAHFDHILSKRKRAR